jgi:hypothetical protein
MACPPETLPARLRNAWEKRSELKEISRIVPAHKSNPSQVLSDAFVPGLDGKTK